MHWGRLPQLQSVASYILVLLGLVPTRSEMQAGMIPIQMELGGKDACIVCEDADIELAAKNIVKVPVVLSQLLGAVGRLMPCTH